MLLDLIDQGGVLLVAGAVAFTISTAVGMMVAWAWERTELDPGRAGRLASGRRETGSGPFGIPHPDAAETLGQGHPIRIV